MTSWTLVRASSFSSRLLTCVLTVLSVTYRVYAISAPVMTSRSSATLIGPSGTCPSRRASSRTGTVEAVAVEVGPYAEHHGMADDRQGVHHRREDLLKLVDDQHQAAPGGGIALACPAAATPPAQAQSARSGVDFRVPGVRIFSRPDGGATRVGLGYPGQGWDLQSTGYGTSYTCDNGVTTTLEHGRNIRTGVVGWVPSCNTMIV